VLMLELPIVSVYMYDMCGQILVVWEISVANCGLPMVVVCLRE
jgi:hypothetical protein